MPNTAVDVPGPAHRSIINAVVDRWRRWQSQREFADFAQLYPDEAERIAREFQMNTPTFSKWRGAGLKV